MVTVLCGLVNIILSFVFTPELLPLLQKENTITKYCLYCSHGCKADFSLTQESTSGQEEGPAASLPSLRQAPWPQGAVSSHAPPTAHGTRRGGGVGEGEERGGVMGWVGLKVIKRLR